MDDLKLFTLNDASSYNRIKEAIEFNEKAEQWTKDIAIYQKGILNMIVMTKNDELAVIVKNNGGKPAFNADVEAIKLGYVRNLLFGNHKLVGLL